MKTIRVTLLAALVWLALPVSGWAFYNPESGGWLNRDPVGERGGANLCQFVRNDPVHYLDDLGDQPMLPPGWTGPGQPYDPRLNPFTGGMAAPSEVADLLDADLLRAEYCYDDFVARSRALSLVNSLKQTIDTYGHYVGIPPTLGFDDVRSISDLLRFGAGAEQGGVEGWSNDLRRGGTIVLTVCGVRCCRTASRSGTATVFQHEAERVHFSVNVKHRGRSLQTHQVVTSPDYSTTAITTADTVPPGVVVKCKQVHLPDAERAMQRQESLIAKPDTGPYDEISNSCVTHVCEVLEAGGVKTPPPKGSAQYKFIRRFLKTE